MSFPLGNVAPHVAHHWCAERLGLEPKIGIEERSLCGHREAHSCDSPTAALKHVAKACRVLGSSALGLGSYECYRARDF